MAALVNVADVLAIVVTPEEKLAIVDLSHLTTSPVWPLRVRSAGAVPAQIAGTADTDPPTVEGLTANVTSCVKVLWQFGVALVTVMPVIRRVCPLLVAVSAGVVKFALPEASATLPVTVCTGPPPIV
jgi:hypothetical protein